MKITCPSCNAVYSISKGKLPAARTLTTCKRCGGSITIDLVKAVPDGRTASASGRNHPDSVTPPPVQQGLPMSTATAALKEIADIYPEVHALSDDKFDLPAILTPTKKGSYKTRKNKYKIRILRAVQDKVGQILNDGEKVMRVGKGTAYYPLELLLGNGWLTMMYNQYAILCTNQRMLFVNINSRINRPTHYLFQIPYTDVKKVRRGMVLNNLILYRHKGKRRIFSAVKRYLGGEIMRFVEESKLACGDTVPGNVSPEKLCPSCFVPLTDGLENCPRCGADFRVPRKAMVRSLLLPGLGDMYLGHRVLGALEMLVSLYVWILVITSMRAGGAENLIVAAVILSIYNGMDGLLTYHMAKKGYMLAGPHPAALNPMPV
jgi:predicted Zn finger-like uncharacterized protein